MGGGGCSGRRRRSGSGASIRSQVDLGGATRVAGPGVGSRSLVASRDNSVEVPRVTFSTKWPSSCAASTSSRSLTSPSPASGAARGMVGSLNDPESRYMDKDRFSAYMASREGKYQGIGAEFEVVLKSLPGVRTASSRTIRKARATGSTRFRSWSWPPSLRAARRQGGRTAGRRGGYRGRSLGGERGARDACKAQRSSSRRRSACRRLTLFERSSTRRPSAA